MNGNLSWRSIFVTPFAMPMRLTALKKRAYLKGIELVYRLRQKMGGYYIGANAEFAQWPFFPHGYSGVYISGGARVGRRYVVFRQVTIGSDSLAGSGKTGSPTIGDDCYIGAGAKNIGSVKICNGCRIGANAVVYKDVPPNSTVVGAWGGGGNEASSTPSPWATASTTMAQVVGSIGTVRSLFPALLTTIQQLSSAKSGFRRPFGALFR